MSETDDIFNGYGLKVELKANFNVVKEALSRIGYATNHNGENTLYQSCHIFHKRGQYAIMHFKEMFAFDGRPADFTEIDEGRRNRIAKLLEEWGLVKLIDTLDADEPMALMKYIKVVPSKEKHNWKFVTKYSIGGKSKPKETVDS